MAVQPLGRNADVRRVMERAAEHALDYLESLNDRAVEASSSPSDSLAALPATLEDAGRSAVDVIGELVTGTAPGITAMGSPRYFGFVIGGALPAALAADWLVSAWDQNAGLASPTPAVAAVEQIAGSWLAEVLGLPRDVSFAFVTGCQMAHFTALAAARHRVFAKVGWDVEEHGLIGAPPLRVFVGAERHVTVDRALRFLGIGAASIDAVGVDSAGAMDAEDLERRMNDWSGPTIVCAQAGNVNTGAIDPLGTICELAHSRGAWVHVDGAFGLWAAASPTRRDSIAGSELADSWATDTHKWLNTPYDCGVAFVADREAHGRAMGVTASYLQQGEDVREPVDWTPEFSRRARSVPVYAALRSLGRDGVAELVDRLCDMADRFAETLAGTEGFDVAAHALNQVLVHVDLADDDVDGFIRALQQEGTCWMSGTTWRSRRCVRISVCNWQTTTDDVDRSVDAMRRVLASCQA